MADADGRRIRLARSGWATAIDCGLQADRSSVRIVSPFIKQGAARRLLAHGTPEDLRVVTRFDLGGFAEGVSDLAALRLLMKHGARVRGVKRLHSKLYLFGGTRAIVTSANLTEAALLTNHELGFIVEDEQTVEECGQYFEFLWERAGDDLSSSRLGGWERKVGAYLARHPRRTTVKELPDEGTSVEDHDDRSPLPPAADESVQAFVKFFGLSSDRMKRSETVLGRLEESGCHWACTYPSEKRPLIVEDDALMFMGWMVEEPDDILIFGRASAERYREGRDDASPADIAARPWKAKWPHYIRVHHAEFIDGTLGDGVSLNELMDSLGSDSFGSTQENARSGTGNTNPRRSYGKHAAVRLSAHGKDWLNDRLQTAFDSHGRVGAAALDSLDWPPPPI